MALAQAVAALLFRRALGAIRAAGGNPDLGQIARTFWNRMDPGHTEPYVSYLNVVRSANRTHDAAGQLGPAGHQPLSPRQHPIDPSLPGARGQYGYRVVIIADPGGGQEPFETAVTVLSDRPLSPDEIRAEAFQMYANQAFERDYKNEVARVGQNPTLDIVILTAGRT